MFYKSKEELKDSIAFLEEEYSNLKKKIEKILTTYLVSICSKIEKNHFKPVKVVFTDDQSLSLSYEDDVNEANVQLLYKDGKVSLRIIDTEFKLIACTKKDSLFIDIQNPNERYIIPHNEGDNEDNFSLYDFLFKIEDYYEDQRHHYNLNRCCNNLSETLEKITKV